MRYLPLTSDEEPHRGHPYFRPDFILGARSNYTNIQTNNMHRFNFSYWAIQNFTELSQAYPHDGGYHRDQHKHTCCWFSNDPRAQAWRDTPKSCIIWVAGSPGQGKSVLSREVAFHRSDWWEESCQQRPQRRVPTTTAYYYFRAGDSQRRSATPAV